MIHSQHDFSHNHGTHSLYTNLRIPNIDAIYGALFTLRVQYEYTQIECGDGARDGIDIWYMGIINYIIYDL